MQYGFVFDQSRCMGCNACTVACKDWNVVNAGPVRWRKHKGHEILDGAGKLKQVDNLVMSCNHCKYPACVKACPNEAIVKDERTGIVSIDKTKCQGVQTCVSACPFGAIGIADNAQEPEQKGSWQIPHPAQKCNMCIDRVNADMEPVCVASCVARAIHWGPLDELKRDYPTAESIDQDKFRYAYQNKDYTTQPSFLIIPRDGLTIHEKK